MKSVLNVILAVALAAPAAGAFDFEVKSIERVPVEGDAEVFHPVFSPDGARLLVTSEAYDGLGVVELTTAKYRRLNNLSGAGYRVAFSEDGKKALVRDVDFFDQKLSLYTQDLASGELRPVAMRIGHVNATRYVDGTAVYTEAEAVRTWADPTVGIRTKSSRDIASEALLTEEDLKLVLYADGRRRVVDPVLDTEGRDVNYCWSSLSPDGTHLLFVAGNDAYTCRTDGTGLVGYGPMHAPVWRDNDTFVAMVDTDDGHDIVSSDIFIAQVGTGLKIRLTPESDKIKMFPAVSPDGNRIAYHTTDGELYIITIVER